MWIDVGTNGASSDAQIFNDTDLKDAILDGSIHFPEAEPLPADPSSKVPYYILADDAFALKPWLMKPHSGRQLERAQRIFNYRLSRARRVVENGIMASRFRCMLTTMHQYPETVSKITLACFTLHNLIRIRYRDVNEISDTVDQNDNIQPGSWRSDVRLSDFIIWMVPRVDLVKTPVMPRN
jgi:hypothetical protein